MTPEQKKNNALRLGLLGTIAATMLTENHVVETAIVGIVLSFAAMYIVEALTQEK